MDEKLFQIIKFRAQILSALTWLLGPLLIFNHTNNLQLASLMLMAEWGLRILGILFIVPLFQKSGGLQTIILIEKIRIFVFASVGIISLLNTTSLVFLFPIILFIQFLFQLTNITLSITCEVLIHKFAKNVNQTIAQGMITQANLLAIIVSLPFFGTITAFVPNGILVSCILAIIFSIFNIIKVCRFIPKNIDKVGSWFYQLHPFYSFKCFLKKMISFIYKIYLYIKSIFLFNYSINKQALIDIRNRTPYRALFLSIGSSIFNVPLSIMWGLFFYFVTQDSLTEFVGLSSFIYSNYKVIEALTIFTFITIFLKISMKNSIYIVIFGILFYLFGMLILIYQQVYGLNFILILSTILLTAIGTSLLVIKAKALRQKYLTGYNKIFCTTMLTALESSCYVIGGFIVFLFNFNFYIITFFGFIGVILMLLSFYYEYITGFLKNIFKDNNILGYSPDESTIE